MKTVALFVLSLLLSGCAFSPQSARIRPIASVAESNVGKGVVVAVRVVDERPDQAIGKRGAGGVGADIVPANQIEVAVQELLVASLKKRGFSVVDSNVSAQAKLGVEVRFLQYSVSQGLWSGGINIKVAIKATASNGGQIYEQLYRNDKEERVQFIPAAQTNENWINESLSKCIQDLLDDTALTEALAGKQG